MRLHPIPKRNLIHTITYEEYKGEDPFGGGGDDFAESETLSRVLFQPKSSLRRDGNGEEIQLTGIIFLDAKNTPDFKPLIEKSRITFNGKDMRVNACKPLYAFDPKTPHHYEIEVV